MTQQSPLLSAEELEALIQGWGAVPSAPVDRFFPVRFYYLVLVAGSYALWLLFNSQAVAQGLVGSAAEVERLARFLYFRGWFLLLLLGVGVYAYLRGWYLALVLSGLLLVGCVNMVFDLFNVHPGQLARPTPAFTLKMVLRLIAMWCLYLSIRNCSRLPPAADRANLLLPFRRQA